MLSHHLNYIAYKVNKYVCRLTKYHQQKCPLPPKNGMYRHDEKTFIMRPNNELRSLGELDCVKQKNETIKILLHTFHMPLVGRCTHPPNGIPKGRKNCPPWHHAWQVTIHQQASDAILFSTNLTKFIFIAMTFDHEKRVSKFENVVNKCIAKSNHSTVLS